MCSDCRKSQWLESQAETSSTSFRAHCLFHLSASLKKELQEFLELFRNLELGPLPRAKGYCDIAVKLDGFDSYIARTLCLEVCVVNVLRKLVVTVDIYVCVYNTGAAITDFDFSSVFQKSAFSEIHLILMLLGFSVHLKGTWVAHDNTR